MRYAERPDWEYPRKPASRNARRLVGAITLVGALALFGLTTFSSAPNTGAQVNAQLPEAGPLTGLGEQAKQLAHNMTADPVLRQVSVDPASGRVSFYFTDAPATVEIDVLVPSPSAPPNQWSVSRPSFSKYVLARYARPGLVLQALRVSPADALQPMVAQWPGCAPRSLTLVGEGVALTWQVFCTLADGRVATGTIDARSGAFQPSPAPPAPPPPTAVPSR